MRTIILAAALALAPAVHAQSAPAGWSVTKNDNIWLAASPMTDAGNVQLAFYPAAKPRGAFPFWFEEEGLRRTFTFGTKITAQMQSQRLLDDAAPPLTAQARTLESASGARTFVFTYAWETPKGRQLAQIVLPHAVGKESAAYKAAFAELTTAWKTSLTYTPVPAE